MCVISDGHGTQQLSLNCKNYFSYSKTFTWVVCKSKVI